MFSMHQYGFGDLERPVQSVTAMYESPYMLSVGEYLMLYLLLKMFVCYVHCVDRISEDVQIMILG